MAPAHIVKSLAWHRRLEARVVAGVSLLVAGSLVAVLVATTRTVTTRSLERALNDLEAARSVFYRLADDRAEFAAAHTSLVTALPVFRTHLTDRRLAGDVATLEAMADEYRRQLKADFCIVTDRHGNWMARSGWPDRTAAPDVIRSTIAEATSGRPARTMIGHHDRLFLVVSEPAHFANELLGTLTTGYVLDDALAQRLAEATHCDVNLVANGHLYASSLGPANRAALAALVAPNPTRFDDGASRKIRLVGAGRYVTGAFPLAPGGTNRGDARLLLLQDWQPTQQFIDQVRRRLLLAGGVIFAVALGGALLFSRATSRPLQDLADAAEDIAAGNWQRQVPVRGGAEATLMAQAFNEMTTSLRHWYEEVKKRDDAAQKLEAIGLLAGGVAHDFNNLLTAIRGYGEMLIESLGPDDPRNADAEEILKASDHAANLTGQLLAFSRRQVVTPRVLALDQIVAKVEQMLGRLIGADIELSTAIEPAIGLVRADPAQIEQVLLNLAVNARDAMPHGGTLRLELANVTIEDAASPRSTRLPPGRRYVRLSVADTGCGMDEATSSHIFEPFFTTKGEGRGTGLGLAKVYDIVEQADGTIDVDTRIGRGTTFHIYLPQTSDAGAAQVEAKPTVARTRARGSATVLIVEDDYRVARLITAMLKKAGYAVLAAEHGERALQIVRADGASIDLLLTDVVMPGMNGRELADQISALRPGMRVLFMSGYTDDAILRHGIEIESTHFIQKPFSMEALAARIREILL